MLEQFNNDDDDKNFLTILKTQQHPERAIIKYLKYKHSGTNASLSEIIGCTKESFDNKMHRNSFSFEQMTKILNAYGYEFNIIKMREN